MRIGINLLFLIPGIVGGTETYATGLLSGLSKIDTQNEYIIFTNRSVEEGFIPVAPNFKHVICPINGRSRMLRYCFEQFYLPSLLRRWKIDIVHSLGYVGPLITPCPSVVTVPDLNYIDMGVTLSWSKRHILRFFSSQASKRANHVITISEFSKKRLVDALRLPFKKITVTYLSAGENVSHVRLSKGEKIRRYYGIKQPYVVAFAGRSVHKNIPRLIQAFSTLSTKYPHTLVLVGHMPVNVEFSDILKDKSLFGRVMATGYVPGEHICDLLGNADLFVLPSLYEGFGIPVLEAQQAGVAVACSKAASLPEVAGKGAVFFEPSSVDEIAQTIEYCLSSNTLCTELRQMGRENLKRFSWEKTATGTLAVYREVLNGN